MTEFIGEVLVTYRLEAGSWAEAEKLLMENTEFPLFPDGVGGCIADKIVSIEVVK